MTTTTYVAPGQPGAGMVKTVTDPKGTITYKYDAVDALGNDEQRGLVTEMVVTGVGTYTAAYDDQASMIVQKAPGGIEQHFTYDTTGQLTSQTYLGVVTDEATGMDAPELGAWLTWTREYDLAGRVVNEYAPVGTIADVDNALSRSYEYDRASRLVTAQDFTGDSGCVERDYAFDKQGNRTSKTVTLADATGDCSTGAASTTAWTYDLSSRVKTAGDGVGVYAYDLLGRTTVLPAADAPLPAAGNISLSYFDSDATKSIAQGTITTSFTQDDQGRRLVETTTDGATTTKTLTRHYTDGSDNPSWIVEVNATGTETSRYTPALGSGLGATVQADGTIELVFDDPHGDVVTTVAVPSSDSARQISGWSSFDEYGNTTTPKADTGAATYGWLGTHERAALDNGLILMGARLYNSVTGRFLSPDPVAGGNENSYNYPNDPINRFDTTGLFDWGLALDIGLTVASFIPIPGLQQVAMIAKIVITVVKVSSAISKVAKAAKAVKTAASLAKAAAKATANRVKAAAKAKAKSLANAAAAKLKKNNYVRWKVQANGVRNLSLGPQQAYWKKMSRLKQFFNPLHGHFERGKGAITVNRTGRTLWDYGSWVR